MFTFPEPKFIATDIPSFSALTLLIGRQDRVHAAYKNPFQLFAYRLKAFPFLIPSVGSGADPGVQAVSPQVTVSHPPGSRLPLLSVMPVVTSPATEHHRCLVGTKLYFLVTEAYSLGVNNLPTVVMQRCLE